MTYRPYRSGVLGVVDFFCRGFAILIKPTWSYCVQSQFITGGERCQSFPGRKIPTDEFPSHEENLWSNGKNH